MGVYINNSNVDTTTGIIECKFEPGIEAALNIVAEGELNYNAIMQAVGIHELAVFESTGEEMVYEAADIRGFAESVKKFFLNLLEKIKGLFKKFFALLDSFVKTDKEFVNKYKKHLLQADTSDFEYKGFEFKNLDHDLSKTSTAMDALITFGNDAIPDADAKSDIVEKLRGSLFTGGSSLDSSEFSKELFSFFRNGEDSKITIDKVSVAQELQNISENSTLKKAAEKAFKDIEKVIKDAIKKSDKDASDIIKTIPKSDTSDESATKVKAFSTTSYLLKEKLAVLQVANGAKLTAIKDQNRQSKSICVSLMNYKPKHEGYSFEDTVNESFLSGVVIK